VAHPVYRQSSHKAIVVNDSWIVSWSAASSHEAQLRSQERVDQLDQFNSQSIVTVRVWQATDDVLEQCCSDTQRRAGTTQPTHILTRNKHHTISGHCWAVLSLTLNVNTMSNRRIMTKLTNSYSPKLVSAVRSTL